MIRDELHERYSSECEAMDFETRDTRICDSGLSVQVEQEKRLQRSSDKDRGGRMNADEYHACKRTTMAYRSP
jgi:hypothetical protein